MSSSDETTRHAARMRDCYALARSAAAHGNHPFGALLVWDGEEVLRAENTVNQDGDPTSHAELNLVRLATQRLSQAALAECWLYASTEPCAMCAGAIYWAGIRHVVFGCSAAALAEITGGSLAIPCRDIFGRARRAVTVIGPVLAAEGIAIHRDFWPEANAEAD